jgi:hypothetical protein
MDDMLIRNGEETMSTRTLEFPETLIQEIEEQGISDQWLNAIIVRLVKLYLEQKKGKATNSLFKTSGADFADRLIDKTPSCLRN